MKISSKTLMVLSIALGLAACNPDDPMTGHVVTGSGGTGGAVKEGTGGSAGTGGAAQKTGPAAFLGTWRYQPNSKTSVSCADGTAFDAFSDGTETETFTAGTQASEVVATDDGGCSASCSITNISASCAAELCNGVTLTSDVYTRVGDQLHENVIGSAQLEDGTLCTFTATDNVLDLVP
ncbi:MAG TPA: hypothetical protein VKQ32_01945 [Polyangia bacterium]|nr:hypothetical protein [Polyangia bacterium]